MVKNSGDRKFQSKLSDLAPLIAGLRVKEALLLFGIALAVLFKPATLPGACQVGLPRVVIASGGPYEAKDTSIQKFRDRIDLPGHYATQPLSMLFTNGSYSHLGFNWVRVFLLPNESDVNFQAGSETQGRLLVDERSFVNSSQFYLDLTGQLNAGENRLYIEGAAPAGSVFSWELRSAGPPELSPLNPHSTVSGARLSLSGFGFSLRPQEDAVKLGPAEIPVLAASNRSLQVQVPPGFMPGTYDLSVAVAGYPSRPIKMTVYAGAEVTSTEYATVASGQQMNIYGKNFSATAAENAVYIGNQRAQVTTCSDSTITVTVPKVESAQSLPVTVFVGGAQAKGNPTVRITR